MWRSVVVLAVLGAWCVTLSAAAFPVVQTSDGPVVGVALNGTFNFLGIPFAAPPVGALRFAAPSPVSAWVNPLNTTKYPPGCIAWCNMKLGEIMCAPNDSEDCLYLNVFTPKLGNSSGLRPVFFFIHGGVFNFGAGGLPFYDGNHFAQFYDVVVVEANYRLNIFGGLYTGTVKGNFMLQDQRYALQWVRKNIMAFGGDPNNVLLTGQSAGAASVAAHLVSPASWPLFQKAAMISNPYGIIPHTPHMATELGIVVLLKLGCPIGGSEELACLRSKTVQQLMAVVSSNYLPTPDQIISTFMPWQPVVDGEELPILPIAGVAQGKFNRVPLFVGTVLNESLTFVYNMNIVLPSSIVNFVIDYLFGKANGARVKELYGPIPPGEVDDARHYLSEIITDYMFLCPTRYVAAQAAQHGVEQTFTYLFTQIPQWARWATTEGTNKVCESGVCHSFDLASVFHSYDHLPRAVPPPTAEELLLSARVQQAWANFMRAGKPSLAPELWPAYSNASRFTGELANPFRIPMILNYRGKYCDYFDSIGYDRR